ncbi:MAG: TFIIB-type zinc ribbon-containing protein [Haloarculaceae archaeon]
MRIRGERECTECGTRWSYYETGSVNCPACGSLRSVGVDERTEHTAGTASLNLTAAREALDRDDLREAVDVAKSACREYARRVGFIHAGELQPLDDTYLAALELVHAADIVGRSFAPSEAEELYFFSLLRGADFGERPDADAVPESMREARGLAVAEAVDQYRTDVRTYLGGEATGPVGQVLERLSDHARRVRALEGDVPVAEAETLVRATRDLTRSLADDEDALATAQDRLDRLA